MRFDVRQFLLVDPKAWRASFDVCRRFGLEISWQKWPGKSGFDVSTVSTLCAA
jgi:hypothetical protein